MRLMRPTVVLIAIAMATVTLSAQSATPQSKGSMPVRPHTGPAIVTDFPSFMVTPPPAELGLDPFYKKYADAFGIPIVGSERLPDTALLMARDIVNYMLLKRPDVRQAIVDRKGRVLIMAESEGEMDLPERSNWTLPTKDDRRLTNGERENYDKPGGIGSMTATQYWNNRARGMGGSITSAAEENIMGYPGTKYFGEHILVHEFSHNIMGALQRADPALHAEIQPAYEAAKAAGKYKGQYAINTVAEYFAEGTQWWFWSNIEFYDAQRSGVRVQSPDDLKAYDPTLYAILEKVYAGHHIPADIYYGRNLRPIARSGSGSLPEDRR
ncbi:MAG: glycoside hydrolase [Acidobacteria bacterium]|nr:glycoside hydrolase [Acidobacteriota bacterium]